MKYVEIKNIPFMANILVATEPGATYLGIPKNNIRELFRVDVDDQTLYFDFEDDDKVIVRVRKAFWKPLEINSWLLTPGEMFSIEMVRDNVFDAPSHEKQILLF